MKWDVEDCSLAEGRVEGEHWVGQRRTRVNGEGFPFLDDKDNSALSLLFSSRAIEPLSLNTCGRCSGTSSVLSFSLSW